jgi:hypothetical protein
MGKRGQITVFLIIGIIIIVVFLLLAFFSKTQQQPEDISLDFDNLELFIESCNQIVGVNGAYDIAAQGGYYDLPAEYSGLEGYNVIYAYQRSNPGDLSLTLEQIQDNYGQYMIEKMPSCTNNFEDFKGLDIEEKEITADVEIFDDKIFVKTVYNIVIDIRGSKTELAKESFAEIPIRFGVVHQASKEIIGWIIEDPDFIALADIDDLMENIEGDITTDIDVVGDLVQYTIKDTESSILSGNIIVSPSENNKQFEYVFGAKFD